MATFCIIFSVIKVDLSPDSVGVIDVSEASTTTVSLAIPGTNLIPATERWSAEFNVMPLACQTLKPAFSTITVYIAGGTEAKVKYPSELLIVERLSPLASFFSVTVASATTAPEASKTVPVNVALVCCAEVDWTAANETKSARTSATERVDSLDGKSILQNELIRRRTIAVTPPKCQTLRTTTGSLMTYKGPQARKPLTLPFTIDGFLLPLTRPCQAFFWFSYDRRQ